MAIYSSIIAWRIPQTKEPGRLQSIGVQRVDMTERLSMHAWTLIPTLILFEQNVLGYKSLNDRTKTLSPQTPWMTHFYRRHASRENTGTSSDENDNNKY